MIKYISAIFLGIVFILSGCINKNREERLNQREAVLAEREKQLGLKEAEFQSLIRMRDSLLAVQKDTIISQTWPEEILGLWSSRVVCTESNCNNYVVGDVRTDQWEFGYDSTRLIAKVSNVGKLMRVYNGSYRDSVISLRFTTDSASARQFEINVAIAGITPRKLKGTRTVTVENGCKAVFSVELTKQKDTPE